MATSFDEEPDSIVLAPIIRRGNAADSEAPSSLILEESARSGLRSRIRRLLLSHGHGVTGKRPSYSLSNSDGTDGRS
jgi:hypothetical protein